MLEVHSLLPGVPRRCPHWTSPLAELLAAVQRCLTPEGSGVGTADVEWVWFQLWVIPSEAYHGIDPSVVPGSQIQDAGAVDFVAAGVDSEHGGCFMNAGTTYCVAPIVTNGTIHHSVGGAPRYGSFDYFAVGVDCCSCLG